MYSEIIPFYTLVKEHFGDKTMSSEQPKKPITQHDKAVLNTILNPLFPETGEEICTEPAEQTNVEQDAGKNKARKRPKKLIR